MMTHVKPGFKNGFLIWSFFVFHQMLKGGNKKQWKQIGM